MIAIADMNYWARSLLPAKDPGLPRYVRVRALGRREARHRIVWGCGCWVEFSGWEPPPSLGPYEGDIWSMAESLRWRWTREFACCLEHGGPGETADRDWGLH